MCIVRISSRWASVDLAHPVTSVPLKSDTRSATIPRRKARRRKMDKPRMIGMNRPYIPNSKADSRRKKPFMGAHRKGKVKK